MKKKVILLPAIVALVAGAALATPITVYYQPPTSIWGGLESSAEPAVIADASWPVRRSADDIMLNFDGEVTQLRWWGHSSDGDNTTTEYNIDQITGFLIEFFEEEPTTNGVGASIYSEVVTVGATAPAVTSYVAYDGSPVFVHSVNLSREVVFSAHTRYWLSIAAYRKSDPRWVWFKTSRGNHFYDLDIGVDGIWDGPYRCSDVAFELVIPEPTTVVLFALGGLTLLRRRKL